MILLPLQWSALVTRMAYMASHGIADFATRDEMPEAGRETLLFSPGSRPAEKRRERKYGPVLLETFYGSPSMQVMNVGETAERGEKGGGGGILPGSPSSAARFVGIY